MKKKHINILNEIRKYTFIISLTTGLIKVFLAVISKSIILLISSFYNFSISATKHRAVSEHDNPYKKYMEIGVLIMTSSFAYTLYSIYVIITKRQLQFNMYLAILIAAIAFTDLIVSSIGLIQAKKNDDIETEMIKFANLSSAFIGIALTQTAILSFTLNIDVSAYNGIVGILFGGLTSVIGIYMIIRGLKMDKKEEKKNVNL
ncbi:MAG: hypothetical protein IKF17_04035 [Clostridia bacterium]|nr:hypothetical protein [Clostridia bacterium]